MRTLSQILVDANAYLDLDASLPTGDDLTTRTNYAQQAVREWADSYEWRQLKVSNYSPTVTTLASLSLPSDFRNLLTPVQELLTSGSYEEYPEIVPEERYEKDAADKYCYVLGNQSAGHTVVVNNLTANASISIDYQRYPSNMATLTDICEVPNPDYVKMKIISYVLQSRSDERFPTVDAEAQRLLVNMIGREQIRVPGGVPRVRRVGSASYSLGSR